MNGSLSTGVIGYGRLGAEIAARLARGIPGLKLGWICDPLEARRLKAYEAHSEVNQSDSFRQVPDGLGAVILCASPRDEWTPAEFFLSKGIHVIAAPPLAPSATALSRLADIASKGSARFIPLRLFSRHPAWEAFRNALADLEAPRLFDIRMATFGPFSTDLSVHRAHSGWVLPEVLPLIGAQPLEVSLIGKAAVSGGPADLGALAVEFEGGLSLMLSLSRVSPEEGLKVLALGERRLVEFYTNHASFAEARIHNRRAHFEEGVNWTSPDSAPRILSSEEMDTVSAGLLDASKRLDAGEIPDLFYELMAERILDGGWASARLGGPRVRLTTDPSLTAGR